MKITTVTIGSKVLENDYLKRLASMVTAVGQELKLDPQQVQELVKVSNAIEETTKILILAATPKTRMKPDMVLAILRASEHTVFQSFIDEEPQHLKQPCPPSSTSSTAGPQLN